MEAFHLTRKTQDDHAARSRTRPSRPTSGREIAPRAPTSRRDTTIVAHDEQPGTTRPEKIPTLRLAFRKGGAVTAADSSSISDDATGLVLASGTLAAVRCLTVGVRVRIRGSAAHGQATGLFTVAFVPASHKLMDRPGWTAADLDPRDVVPKPFKHEIGLDSDMANVHRNFHALGDPIDAPRARITVTLLQPSEARGMKRAVAATCIGGGGAFAIELL